VALMPYRDVSWIHYCNPIKLKEYLALGLPVVSTDFSQAHRFAPWIRIATGEQDFLSHVDQALQEQDPALRSQRRASLDGQEWSDKARELLALYEERA